ncbi:hypothetical protein [Paenibacillus koleovorans]|uniref:hypothetical protein n=1 Tax=Paenibacillus koleovorans TaxID=121608 RepID=UPI000FD92D56|nr:hypothetical protein [Paenibacillus koleovorans]
MDCIENTLSWFKYVAHVVRSDGTETDVVATLFLKEEGDVERLKVFLADLLRSQRDAASETEGGRMAAKPQKSPGRGWLSHRKKRY